MKPVIVCGSVAIDLIGSYAGSFQHYQENYPTRGLNISLQLKSLTTSFGGCGMNIAYGLSRLEQHVIPISAAGLDFQDHYLAHLNELGIDSRYIAVDDAFERTAQCIIFSDESGNQITAFNSGASVSEKRVRPAEVEGIDQVFLAILAPEDAPIMLKQARDLNELNIPIFLDPGQGVAEFTREEILELLSLSDYLIMNGHEWEIIQTKTGIDAAEIVQTHEVIVTRGSKGVDIHRHNATDIHVNAATARSAIDSTGCGDAFRAGYVFGLLEGFGAKECAELGCLMAVYNLESMQTQQYKVTRQELLARHLSEYGESQSH